MISQASTKRLFGANQGNYSPQKPPFSFIIVSADNSSGQHGTVTGACQYNISIQAELLAVTAIAPKGYYRIIVAIIYYNY